MNESPNRFRNVANGEAFPAGMVGFRHAAAGDVTIEYANGEQHTHVGLPVGFHEIEAARLISGGPVEAHYWEPEVAKVGPARPTIPDAKVLLEVHDNLQVDTDGRTVLSWTDDAEGTVFLPGPEDVILHERGFLRFEGFARLRAAFAATGNRLTAFVVAASAGDASEGLSWDYVVDGDDNVAAERPAITRRPENAGFPGYWAIGNGSEWMPTDGTGQPPYVRREFHYMTAIYNGAAGDSVLRVDGVERGSGPLGDYTCDGLTIGNAAIDDVLVVNCGVAAYFLVNAIASAETIAEVETYLRQRYAGLLAAPKEW